MSTLHELSGRAVGRYNAAVSEAYATTPDGRLAERLAVGEVALIVAILEAVVAGCDALNPGWRDWLVGVLPWTPSPAELRRRSLAREVRGRAGHALSPESAPDRHRRRARQDRACLIWEARSHVPPDACVSFDVLADSILGMARDAGEPEVAAALQEMARP